MNRPVLLNLFLSVMLMVILVHPGSAQAAAVNGESKKAESLAIQTTIPLQLSGYTQLQFSSKNTEADTFSVNRARLSLSGSLLKWLRFKIQVELAKSPVLRDALAEIPFSEQLNLRFGQFLVPFSLENTTSAGELLTVNRSQTVDLLAPGRDNGATGRDQGLVLFGRHSIFEYYLGLLNGSGINRKDDNDRKDFSGRLLLKAGPGLKLGFSLYQGKKTVPGNPTYLVRNKYGLEASYSAGRFAFQAEYIRATDDLQKKQGWYTLLGYTLIPHRVQLIGRLDSVNLDLSLPGQKTTIYTTGLNWFVSSKSKFQVNYEYHDRQSERDTHALLAQLQVGF